MTVKKKESNLLYWWEGIQIKCIAYVVDYIDIMLTTFSIQSVKLEQSIVSVTKTIYVHELRSYCKFSLPISCLQLWLDEFDHAQT